MAISFDVLFTPRQVDNVAADSIFSVSGIGTVFRKGRVRLVNPTAVAVTIKMWMVPFAGTAADDNCILPTQSIAANSYIDIDLPTVVAGTILQAQAGAAASITISQLDGFVQ